MEREINVIKKFTFELNKEDMQAISRVLELIEEIGATIEDYEIGTRNLTVDILDMDGDFLEYIDYNDLLKTHQVLESFDRKIQIEEKIEEY